MQVAEITARDGFRLRTGCWMPASAGGSTCLIFTGRSEFLEKYDLLARRMTEAGHRVVSVDWRGQGLSQRFDVPPTAGHVDDFDQYCLDMDAVVRHWRVATDRLGLFAHSMGAPIALRWLTTRRHPATSLVLSSPMFRLRALRRSGPVVRRLARRAVRFGRGRDFASRTFREWDPERERFADNPLTGDPEAFRIKPDYFARRPQAAVGGPTWGWIDAAFRAVAALSPAALGRLDVPALITLAGADTLVMNRATRRVARRLADPRLVVYPDARHELHMERPSIREPFIADVLAFLEQPVPGRRADGRSGQAREV